MKRKPKHMIEEQKKPRRLYLLFVLIAFLIVAALATATYCVVSQPLEIVPPTEPPVYIGRIIVDKRYTPPDCYELLYFTGYDNGFGVEQWKEVSREEYERSVIDVRP